MQSGQILIVIIVVIVIILLLMLIGWGWWSDQSGGKVSDETYRKLLLLRSQLDDRIVFTREYSLQLSENSPGTAATAKHLEGIHIAIARHLFPNCEDGKANELAALWATRLALLKRSQQGESDAALAPEITKNNAAIVALTSAGATGPATVKLQEIVDAENNHTFEQLKDFTTGNYDKSFATYALIKKDNSDLYDWLYAAIIRNKKA